MVVVVVVVVVRFFMLVIKSYSTCIATFVCLFFGGDGHRCGFSALSRTDVYSFREPSTVFYVRKKQATKKYIHRYMLKKEKKWAPKKGSFVIIYTYST